MLNKSVKEQVTAHEVPVWKEGSVTIYSKIIFVLSEGLFHSPVCRSRGKRMFQVFITPIPPLDQISASATVFPMVKFSKCTRFSWYNTYKTHISLKSSQDCFRLVVLKRLELLFLELMFP